MTNNGDRWTIIGVGAVLLVGMGGLFNRIDDLGGTVGEWRERMTRVETRLNGMDARLGHPLVHPC